MPYKNIEQQKEYQRKWAASRRAKFLKDKSCEKCGRTDSLHFHHVEPSKKKEHRVWTWSESRIKKELSKCIVLCSTCHMRLHKCKPLKHGTAYAYNDRGCRCEICRAYKARTNKAYQQRLKLLISG